MYDQIHSVRYHILHILTSVMQHSVAVIGSTDFEWWKLIHYDKIPFDEILVS